MEIKQPPPSKAHEQLVPSETSSRTRFAKKVDSCLQQVTDPVDVIGSRLFGEWWEQFVLAIRDAFAIGCFTWIPNLVFKFFSSGKDFSKLDNCIQIGMSDPSSFICFGLVMTEYCFWVLFFGKSFARVIHQIRSK